MSTFLAWVICIGIIGWILVGIFAQVWEESAEIAREEQRKADWREVNHWKQKALRPVVQIRVLENNYCIDGKTYFQKGGEIYIQEDLRNERKR